MKKTIFLLSLLVVTFSAFALTRYPVYTSGASLIQAGQLVAGANGLATQSFAFSYSAVPRVVLTPHAAANVDTNSITSITTTNFIIKTDPSITNQWIAVGAP